MTAKIYVKKKILPKKLTCYFIFSQLPLFSIYFKNSILNSSVLSLLSFDLLFRQFCCSILSRQNYQCQASLLCLQIDNQPTGNLKKQFKRYKKNPSNDF